MERGAEAMSTATITLDAGTAVETIERTMGGGRPFRLLGGDDSESGRAVRREYAADIAVPADDGFDESGILDSWPIEQLATQLIEDFPELRHIRETTVKYAWRKKGGSSKGAPVLGRCVPLSGHAKHYAEADFLVLLSADEIRDRALGPYELEALLFHELLHIGMKIDEDEASSTYGEVTIKAVAHDFEGFWSEIERYPGWREELRQTENTFQQARLALVSDGESR